MYPSLPLPRKHIERPTGYERLNLADFGRGSILIQRPGMPKPDPLPHGARLPARRAIEGTHPQSLAPATMPPLDSAPRSPLPGPCAVSPEERRRAALLARPPTLAVQQGLE